MDMNDCDAPIKTRCSASREMELHFEDTYIQILEEKYFSLSKKK